MTPFRERNPIGVGGVSILVIFALIAFAFSLDRLTFLRGVYTVQADFADAAGLTPENEVRVAGLRVGKVRTIELASDGSDEANDRVRVTMEIDGGIMMGSATNAEIKLKTLLGAKFVDLTPLGAEPFLQEGDLIPLDRTVIPFELYQATDQTVESIGELDADALNELLKVLADVTEDPDGNLGRALRGLAQATEALAEREADLEELIRGSEDLLGTLADRSEELGRIIDNSARLLGALSERRTALKRFVRETDRVAFQFGDLLRSTRDSLDPALRDLHEILTVVGGRQDELDATLLALGPTGEAFARVFNKGPWADIFTATIAGTPLPVGSDLTGVLSAAGGGAP